MRIINVITTVENSVEEIQSFAVVDEQLSDEVAQQAEDYFTKKIHEVAGYLTPEQIDNNMETYLEDGSFIDYTTGVALVWSDVENV